MTNKQAPKELKSRGDEMEYGANRATKRAAARANLMYRLFRARRDAYVAIGERKRDAKNNLNLNTKPLGA